MTGAAVISRQQLGDRLVEYELDSVALAGRTRLRILFPESYADSAETRFPVLYLLHGGDDDYRSWTDKGEAAAASADLQMIIVMPDARNGFYSDWVKPGRLGVPRWETYHLGELVPWVDATFRTIPRRESRAAAGLSMGGFGAFSYAARHPDLFATAASFSGVLDTNRHPWVTDIAGRRDGGTFGAIWGDRLTRSTRWRAHNPWDLAANLRGLALTIRTGTGIPGELDRHSRPDPIEAIVYHQSVRLHRKLGDLGIDHAWHRGRGTHDWPYWIRDLRTTLPEIARVFADPPRPPSPFSYKSAEPEFLVWGWTVRFSSAEPKFCILSDVDSQGFALSGTGMATVRTASYYPPGEPCPVHVDGVRIASPIADRQGRLTVPMRLGRSTTWVKIG